MISNVLKPPLPENLCPSYQEDAGEQPGISNRKASAIAFPPGLNRPDPDTGSKHLPEADTIHLHPFKQPSIWIGDCPSLRPGFIKELLPFLDISGKDEDDRRKRLLPPDLCLEFFDGFLAENSAQMPQEYEKSRFIAPLLAPGLAYQIHSPDRNPEKLSRYRFCFHSNHLGPGFTFEYLRVNFHAAIMQDRRHRGSDCEKPLL